MDTARRIAKLVSGSIYKLIVIHFELMLFNAILLATGKTIVNIVTVKL